MKIYFSAAIYYKAERGKYYDRVIATLSRAGHTIFSYGVNNLEIKEIVKDSKELQATHYRRVVKWIVESDVVVVEASFPSTLHIGHEISVALEKGKPVVVLFEKGFKPFFLNGSDSDKLLLAEYTDHNLEQVVLDSVEYVSDVVDTRFNFFISPQIGAYLDWVSKNKRVPRAVYLRRLIEQEMKANPEYNEE